MMNAATMASIMHAQTIAATTPWLLSSPEAVTSASLDVDAKSSKKCYGVLSQLN